MTSDQILVIGLASMVNGVVLANVALFIFSFVKYELVREKVIESFENGDDIAHTQDAYKAVTLFFAFVFGWADLDMIFVWAYSGKDLLGVVLTLTTIFGGLIGVSFKK